MLLQRPTTSIRPQTSAHLMQTMALLALNTAELRQALEQELNKNPALELLEEHRCPTCGRRLPRQGYCPVCLNPAAATSEQPLVYLSNRQELVTSGSRSQAARPENPEETNGDEWQAAEVTLAEHILRQLAAELQPAERRIAAHLLSALDEDGLLSLSPVEIARFCRTPLSEVLRVQERIQQADPPGVGASTPQAAMLAQLQALSETHVVPAEAFEIVQTDLALLGKLSPHELAARLSLSPARVQAAMGFIRRNLTPYPARAHWGEIRHGSLASGDRAAYTSADVVISLLHNQPDSPLLVEIAAPLSGYLRLNPLFRQALEQAPPEKSAAWQADFNQASLLLKCLQQRNHTLVRMLQHICRLQRPFILHGDEHLRPLTRAWLAEQLELHESTISRAVAGKTIQLPNRRILPLASFFDRSLSVRTIIRQMIEQETHPLSDQTIAEILLSQGHTVARRTVAKYRAMEGLLPAHLRSHAKSGKK